MADTDNSLTASNKEYWQKKMQMYLKKKLVCLKICKMSDKELIKDGDTINNPYPSRHFAETYTKGVDFSPQALSTTNEALSIDQAQIVPAYIDKIDEVQNSYPAKEHYSKEFVNELSKKIDAVVLSEYDQATSDVDAGDIGGTDGTSAVATSTNINRIFSAAGKYLRRLDVPEEERFAVIGPSIMELLQLYTGGKDTPVGDKVLDNGYVGSRFGFEIYNSNNLTWTGRWTPANNPTDGDSITINGVVLTFVDTLGSTAGNVHIGDSTAHTLDILVAALEAPGTTVSEGTNAGFVALSLANQRKLKTINATDGASYIGIEFVGGGEIVVAASESADPWSLETVHCLFGKKGAIELALQLAPTLGFNQAEKRPTGSGYLHAFTIYGYKTWTTKKPELVDVNIDASDF